MMIPSEDCSTASSDGPPVIVKADVLSSSPPRATHPRVPSKPVERSKRTGIYAADLIPGHYLKTLTGTTRGEELFSRPELERPWRTPDQQAHCVRVAKKEAEIEALMALCSDLRTQLGNAHSDAKTVVFAVQEQAKRDVAERDEQLREAHEEVKSAKEALERATRDVDHQIRLLKAQHEADMMTHHTKLRMTEEKLATAAANADRHLANVKEAAAKELQLMETHYSVVTEELKAEKKEVEARAAAEQAHLQDQLAHERTLVTKVETEYKDRLRRAEEASEEMRKSLERIIARERDEKRTAQDEAKKATEKLAVSTVEEEEIVQRFKRWSQHLLVCLDDHYQRYVDSNPQQVVGDVVDSRLQELPLLYLPRTLQQDPQSKMTVERVVLRLIQLESITFDNDSDDKQPPAAAAGGADGLPDAEEFIQRQQRLRSGMNELEDRHRELAALGSALRSRLSFFSDDLQQAMTSYQIGGVLPPLPSSQVTFVCLAIEDGNTLWTDHPEATQTALSYFHATVRWKVQEYGAYECIADGVSVLLAFADPVAACRLAVDVQYACTHLCWPKNVLEVPAWKTVWSSGSDGTGEGEASPRKLYAGPRIAAAVHTGPCHMETTGIPLPSHTQSTEPIPEKDAYRAHYYGRAVMEAVYLCSMTHGGQVLVSDDVWASCAGRQHQISPSLVVGTLGRFPLFSVHAGGEELANLVTLLQVTHKGLEGRHFPSSPVLIGSNQTRGMLARGLDKVKNACVATAITALDTQQSAVEEGLRLLRNELRELHELSGMMEMRSRRMREQFHLLPPTEMVSQLNELFLVLEEVADMSDEASEEMKQMSVVQEDIRASQVGLRSFLNRYLADTQREATLRTQHEVQLLRLEAALRDAQVKRFEEVEKLQLAVHERDEVLRLQSMPPGSGLLNAASRPAVSPAASPSITS